MAGVEIERTWRQPALLLKALPTVLLQTLFFAAPLALTFAMTFQRTKDFRLDWVWTLETWTEVFSKPHFWTVLGHTLWMSCLCVILCTVIGFPIAYALATRVKRWATPVQILLMFAFLTDATLKTFGWALFLDSKGAGNYLLALVGLPEGMIGFLFTEWATMLGMVYNLLPFTIFTIYLSIVAIDRSLILAAYDCGASKLRALWEVTLPLSRPGIWAGAVLVFLLAVGSFLEPKVLGGGRSPMMADLIRQTFETRVNWPLGAALTFVLMVVASFAVLLFSRVYALKHAGA